MSQPLPSTGGGGGGQGTPPTGMNTTKITDAFTPLIEHADKKIEDFMAAQKQQQAGGSLELSATEGIQIQKLMTDQTLTVQIGTSVLKSFKDSIMATLRNIS